MTSPSSAKPCRVALVEDHPFMREGVSMFIAKLKDFECAWMAATAGEADVLIEKDLPDLLVVDITLPDRSGLELIKSVHDLHPKLPMIVLSMHDEKLYAQRALKAGARGYLRKDAPYSSFEDAFRKVLAGGLSVSDALTDGILQAFAGSGSSSSKPKGNGLEALSNRELQVFQLLGEGKSTHDVAAALHISTKTVDLHKMSVRTKLKLEDGAAVVRMAIRLDEAGRLGGKGSL